ncbi:MAG: YraN family protein [Solirubrobacteraceae bacterium]|nr:YraN family protein [Solirubrobacteraceae bacterium]
MTSEDPRRSLGRDGEHRALEHLQRRGYALVERNHRTRHGEIDLIVCDGRALVFVEVKTRRPGPRAGTPLQAIPPAKQAQVRRMARAWLAATPDRPRVPELRFDAIGVTVDGGGRLVALDHLEGCF